MEVQVNESNGGLLSNTPPETRQIGENKGRASLASEDTAHCSLWVTWMDAGGLYRTLAHAKAQAGGVLSRPIAKNAASSADNPSNLDSEVCGALDSVAVHGHQDYYAEIEGLQPGEVEFGGVIWMVHPGGVKGGRGGLYYPFMLTAEGITLKLRDVDPDDKTPNLMAEMGSIPLAQRGGLEPLWAYLPEVITRAGGRIDKHRLSRVDVYTDLAGVHAGPRYSKKSNANKAGCDGASVPPPNSEGARPMNPTEHDTAAASPTGDTPANTRDTLTALTKMPPETLLSEKALAQCLCVVGKTIRRVVTRGDLPKPPRMGKRKYWKAGFVAAWIDRLAQLAQGESGRLFKIRQDMI